MIQITRPIRAAVSNTATTKLRRNCSGFCIGSGRFLSSIRCMAFKYSSWRPCRDRCANFSDQYRTCRLARPARADINSYFGLAAPPESPGALYGPRGGQVAPSLKSNPRAALSHGGHSTCDPAMRCNFCLWNSGRNRVLPSPEAGGSLAHYPRKTERIGAGQSRKA